MEHKSKTGGESLRNQDVVNEDRISELPEDLLVQILSSLETNCVIATSVLSKSWRCLWKMVPNIKFCSGDHKTEEHSFSEIVCRSLLSSNCPFLESFYLVDEKRSEEALDVERMIEIAFARHVRKLVLDVPLNFEYEEYISIPSGLCSCNNTLEILELGGNLGTSLFRLDFPCRVGLKSLKKLQLNYADFLDEESVCNLLCGCPSLEDLVIYRHGNFDAPTFTIAVPSLQRLTIVDTFRGKSNGGYVINALSLKYLNIKGIGKEPWGRCFETRREWYGFCRIENAPELVEAKIICVYELHVHNENIMVSLTSAKRLSLDFSPLEINCPTGIIFYQLVSLELHTSKIGWSTLLARMLDSSPNLQILKLTIEEDRYYRKVFVKDGGWEQPPKCVPECLLFHLETLVWTRYVWDHEGDKQVATYILQNARRLKKATFYIEPIKIWQTLEEKREMLNELDSVVRASDSCHLVFKSSS